MVTAIFSFCVSFLMYLFLQESPRYLEQQKKYHEAFLILKKMAKINGKQDSLKNETEIIMQLTLNAINNNKDPDHSKEARDENNNKSAKDDTQLEFLISHNETQLNGKAVGDLKPNPTRYHHQSSSDDPRNKNVLVFIFSSKRNFIQIVLLLYIWFAIQLIYFGISLGIY
jgi:hypothetical protein